MNKLKKIIRNNKRILFIATFLYRVFGFNFVLGKHKLKLKWNNAAVRGMIVKNYGVNNSIIIKEGCRLKNCKINILGNNNTIHIKNDSVANKLDIWVQDNNNLIEIGSNTWFNKSCHLACIEGKYIKIGDQCLFSSDVVFRTGDSHSIIDKKGNRINYSDNITVGTHVWIGNRVTVLKGATIGDNSVIGTGTIVTGKQYISNSLITGVPARVIKSDINWRSENI